MATADKEPRRELGPVRQPTILRSTYTEDINQMRDMLRTLHAPEQEEGLNTQRVASFLQGMGFTMKPYIILDTERIEESIAFLQSNKLLEPLVLPRIPSFFTIPSVEGFYSAIVDLIFLKRNKKLETGQSSVTRESFLVHEQIHANHLAAYGADNPHNQESYVNFRSGWITRESNSFLEEGYAYMLDVEYRKRFLPSEEKVKLSLGTGDIDSLTYTDTDIDNLIPTRYLFVANDTIVSTIDPVYSIAGFSLELLVKMNPFLYPALQEARKSVGGLQTCIQVFNRIHPGLYIKLRNTPPTEEGSSETFRYIKDCVLEVTTSKQLQEIARSTLYGGV